MGKLVYTAITSLDLYINDASGKFEWAMPDAEVHRYVNDLERSIGTYLYGRRLYDTMVFWETVPEGPNAVVNDYARIWRAADKIVFSRTLREPRSVRTRVLQSFDPQEIRALKAASPGDLSIGGSALAATALKAGLVDEIRLFLNPVIVGGGSRALPDGLWQELELIDERRFASGVVLVGYRSKTKSAA